MKLKSVVTNTLIAGMMAASFSASAMAQEGDAAPEPTVDVKNMSALTCADFMEALNSENSDVVGIYVIWLDGYAAAEDGEPNLDPEWIGSLAETVAESCVGRLNANSNVLSLVKIARSELR